MDMEKRPAYNFRITFDEEIPLDGIPKGLSGRFGMTISTPDGKSSRIVYRVHISANKYRGSFWENQGGTPREDVEWTERMFYTLNEFIKTYYARFDVLPEANSRFDDGQQYRGVLFKVDEKKLQWHNHILFL